MSFFTTAVSTMSTLVVALGGDLQASIWSCAAYTVLLCFSLFKTGSVAKSILNAH